MKVLDLQCRQGHVFEGWFGSEDDFQGQKQRGLVQCPLCADDHIEKRLSAPRLNLGARAPAAADTTVPAHPTATAGAQGTASSEAAMLPPALQAAWLALASKVVANTEDVGERFAEEARRMHHGEAQERAIRGQTTPDEAVQLLEEGIAVMPLPLPVAAKETLQ
jgi:hypothetical protein